MKVLGVCGDDVVFAAALTHGADPAAIAYDQGYRVVRPIAATMGSDGDLALRLAVEPRGSAKRPVVREPGQDPGLDVGGAVASRRQRVAAYAVVTSTRGLLATQYSDLTAVAGRWGMPGGGLDPGEEPVAAVLREVAEETSQPVILGDLVRVQTSHWVGRSPRGVIEDFHAVRLVYRATCPAPSDPVVVDAEGTTASARWISLADWPTLPWTQNWRALLTELLPPPEPAGVP